MLSDELYQIMSKEVPKQEGVIKTQLQIKEEDISFDVFCDIYNSEDEYYLYIKLEENSAVAPFFYNGYFSKNDLEKIHAIFKSVNMEQAKEHMKNLFNKKKVKIAYDENRDKEIVVMTCIVGFFAGEEKIQFNLFRQMIPEEEKDSLMIKIYNINKANFKKAKNIFAFLKTQNNIDKQILDSLKETFNLIEKPNTLKDEEIKQLKKIFGKKKRKTAKKDEKGYKVTYLFTNNSSISWKMGSIEFKMDANKSKIICQEINYPIFEIEPNQDGEFYFFFDGNQQPGEYCCFFDVFFNGTKLDNIQLELDVKIKKE